MTKKFKGIVVLCIFMLICINNVVLASSSSYINVPRVAQQKSKWCWAAASKSILNHYGTSVSQNNIVKYIHGYTVNKTGTFDDIRNVLSHFGKITSFKTNSSLSFNSIKSEINNKRPIVAGYRPSTTRVGHIYIVRGYRGSKYISCMNPSWGTYQSKNYSSFSKSWRSSLYYIED